MSSPETNPVVGEAHPIVAAYCEKFNIPPDRTHTSQVTVSAFHVAGDDPTMIPPRQTWPEIPIRVSGRLGIDRLIYDSFRHGD